MKNIKQKLNVMWSIYLFLCTKLWKYTCDYCWFIKYNERICSAYYVTKCRKSIVMIVGVKKGKSEQKKFEFYIVEKANKINDLWNHVQTQLITTSHDFMQWQFPLLIMLWLEKATKTRCTLAYLLHLYKENCRKSRGNLQRMKCCMRSLALSRSSSNTWLYFA